MMRRVGDRPVFEEVADAVRGMVPRHLGPVHCTYHRYGIKVWVGSDKPPREHYEAQVVGRQYAPGAEVLAVEVGFHAEHPKEADNEAVIERLRRSERAWRRALGGDVVVGPFLGRADRWRRVSELWLDPDLGDPELVFELGARLSEYVAALESVRR
jgi:hypothetical protein